MTRQELVNKYKTDRSIKDTYKLSDDENYLIDKLLEAINYTRCCTELLCIDKDLSNFTLNKPYKLVSEPDNQHYVIKDDLGNDRLLFKKFFKIVN